MEVSEESFEKEVLKSSKPIVVDFWAPWCGPCKMLAPVFEKVSKEVTDFKFAKVNVDENTSLASQVGVVGIPCMIVFNKGEEVDRIVGFNTEAQLKEKLAGVRENI